MGNNTQRIPWAGPSDVYAHAARFEVIGRPGRYQLRDTCEFNNWGTLPPVFRTIDGAACHAWRVLDFKEGRSSRVAEPDTSDLAPS